MPMNDALLRSLQPTDKPYKRADERGLYIEVMPNGSKLWRLKYRVAGKEGRLALGGYPEISLASARKARDNARALVADGIDPLAKRKADNRQAKLEAGNSFASIAAEYIETKMVQEGQTDGSIARAHWLLGLLRNSIGTRPITDITAPELLEPLRRIEKLGQNDTANRCRAFASRVFRYAVATGRAMNDPAGILRGALISPKVTHYAAILEPNRFGELLRAIDGYEGSPMTRIALQMGPHVCTRPGELRHAEWTDFDCEAAIWRIPAPKMKGRRNHAVPLSSQMLALLDTLETLTGGGRFLFPSMRGKDRPISENTINAAYRRMGFSGEEVTAHGLRSTASTMMNESGKWHPDAVERSLAHGDSDAVRGIYNRGSYWEERITMHQWWSDRIDVMRDGAEIVPFAPAKAGKG